jgi:uncharacterized repeat protein (TIGR01451 family)
MSGTLAMLSACAKREGALQHSAQKGAKLVLTSASSALTVAVGQSAVFRITVTNVGSRDASRVHIVDTIGKHSKLVSIACEASGVAVCPKALGLTMVADSLPTGAALNFLVTAQLAERETGVILNSMSATTQDDADPDQRAFTDPNDSTITNDVMVR